MKTRTIKQIIKFKSAPHDVYEVLMDSRKHSKFTEASAKISNKVGGKIVAYDGYIEGKNLELVPDKKIVQEWRANDWPDRHFSIATFELRKIDSGTELKFTQEDVPDDQYDAISDGWFEHYWDKMKKIFKW